MDILGNSLVDLFELILVLVLDNGLFMMIHVGNIFDIRHSYHKPKEKISRCVIIDLRCCVLVFWFFLADATNFVQHSSVEFSRNNFDALMTSSK